MSNPIAKLSESETQFLAAIMMNLKTPPDVDWDAVLPLTAFKNKAVMNPRWGQIKRKIKAIHEAEPGTPTKSVSSTPAKTSGSKTKSKARSNEDDLESPTKKRKNMLKKELDECDEELIAKLCKTDEGDD